MQFQSIHTTVGTNKYICTVRDLHVFAITVTLPKKALKTAPEVCMKEL